MAFFGTQNSGGLFGLGGQQQSFRLPIIGIDANLLAASTNAQLARISLNSLSTSQQAQFARRDNEPAVRLPTLDSDPETLNQRIREVRNITNFIDLRDDSLDAVRGDVDRTATFVLFNALSKLRTIAEFAAEDNTSLSSLSRLDEQFQLGFQQVQDYLLDTDLDVLELFIGDKEYQTEATARLGRNSTVSTGSLVAASPDEVLEGLVGNEVFTVSISKGGETDDIVVDLSAISGDLTLRSVTDQINSQIEALLDVDENGDSFIKHQTRFTFERDATGQYGIRIDGTLLEEISLSAAEAAPTLYAVSSVSQLDDDAAVTSRVTEFNNLDGTITRDDTISFAGINTGATEIAEILAEQEEDDDIDPAVATLRDQFRSDARTDVLGEDSDEEDDDTFVESAASITAIQTDNRVNADTRTSQVAVDSSGGIYVVGTSSGDFGSQINTATEQDVFLTKFDTEGNVVFSRLLGVSSSAETFDIKVDSQDNIIIAGATAGALVDSDVVNSPSDAFVVKYTQRGDEVFRYQLDTFGSTKAYAVAIDASDNIFVGGSTSSTISATSGFNGGNDALLLKLDGSSGALLDSEVFGTTGNEIIRALEVDQNGDLIAAIESDNNTASIVRISGSDLTTQNASVELGSLGSGGTISGLSVDTANNRIYLSGSTTNTNLDAGGTATITGTAEGGFEGFVSAFNYSGTTGLSADFTSYVSTDATDRVTDVVVQDGTLYVAGSTGGTFAGELSRGSTDGFVARLDATSGTVQDVEQFGENLATSTTAGLAFTTRGDSVLELLGLPTGIINADQTRDIQTQTSARTGDHFFVNFDTGRRLRIELEEGDTFNDIARKLRVGGFGRLDVEVSNTSDGARLRIRALDDGIGLNLTPGSNGRDLLSRLGIEAGRLLPRNEVFDINLGEDIPPEEDLGGAFGLGLSGELNIRDRAGARYVLGLLDTAISTVQRAFRSTRFDPIRAQLLNGNNNVGPIPARQAAQIANLQSGLARLQSGASSPTFSVFT